VFWIDVRTSIPLCSTKFLNVSGDCRTGLGQALSCRAIWPRPRGRASSAPAMAASTGATTVVWDVESGRELERFEMDSDDSYPSVFVKGYSADGKRIATWSWNGPQQWQFQSDTHAVIASAQERVPRCLHPEQRRRFGLEAVPPRWCITGAGKENLSDSAAWRPKWPFHTRVWRDWLVQRDQGEVGELPQ